MTAFSNAAPKVVFSGINDQSRGTNVRDPETYPQHLPLVHLFTQTGPTSATLVNANSASFNDIFGSQTLDRRGKFFNLQSLLTETMLGEGNAVFVKRLKPEDAPAPARIIVAIDLVEDDIQQRTTALSGFNYPGNVDDTLVFDDDGNPVMVEGYRARIVLIEDNASLVGSQKIVAGSFVSERDGTQSQIYPLFELPASFFGSQGNLLGLRIWPTTVNDSIPFDEKTTEAFMTRLFRMQFLKRDSATSSPVIMRTALDEEYVDVSFMPGVYSESTNKEFYAPEVATQAYADDGIDSGTVPLYSPFSEMHVYQENIEAIQQMIYDRELAVNPMAEPDLLGPGQVDFLSGRDLDGDYYHSIFFEGPLKGGLLVGQETTIYATGGGDGTTSLAEYEKLVVREALNFGDLDDQYDNLPVYPFSVVYDTGLTMDGKYALMTILGRRRDVKLRFTPYVESEGRMPTKSEERSRTQALMARLRAYPESTLYGTPVCRAEIIQQVGRLAGGGYTKPVPQLLDYARAWARFAGAGTGIMREGADIDVSPNNRVELVKDLNVKFFNERTQSDLWENGATYSLSYDRRSQYYPALHSVYSDDTSVLVSPITVSICTDIMRLIHRVHANLSGNAKLTKAQFIERSDNMILQMVSGRYNGRVQVVPRTYFTAADDERGYSWHCEVAVYANNPRTTMVFDLVTRRMDDLGTAA